MRTIEIDDDVYAYIASNTHEIGETASDILRRLLGIVSGNSSFILFISLYPPSVLVTHIT